jgi:hypothetical protein
LLGCDVLGLLSLAPVEILGILDIPDIVIAGDDEHLDTCVGQS